MTTENPCWKCIYEFKHFESQKPSNKCSIVHKPQAVCKCRFNRLSQVTIYLHFFYENHKLYWIHIFVDYVCKTRNICVFVGITFVNFETNLIPYKIIQTYLLTCHLKSTKSINLPNKSQSNWLSVSPSLAISRHDLCPTSSI